MKLGTLREGGRDGQLVVVSRHGTRAVVVPDIAPTLQFAIDNWAVCEPALRRVSSDLAAGKAANVRAVTERDFAAPFPRAYQLLDGGGYMPHLELGGKVRKTTTVPDFTSAPIFYQSVSDSVLAGTDPIRLPSEDVGIDFEAEVAVVTDDVALGETGPDIGRHIKLVMLMNDVSLRFTQRKEFMNGFGFFHSKPQKTLAPFAVTPDECGAGWGEHRLKLPVIVHRNDERYGAPNAGVDLNFDFAALVQAAAQLRPLAAGTIIGGGTVSNWDRSLGQCCIHERRILELLDKGAEQTQFMRFGERVRIEVLEPDGTSLFGAIDQTIAPAGVSA